MRAMMCGLLQRMNSGALSARVGGMAGGEGGRSRGRVVYPHRLHFCSLT